MSTALPPPEPASIPLEGRLGDPSALARLFAWLGRGEWSGMLLVRAGDVERRVYFVEGRVSTAGSTDPAESLASCLIREGLLTEEERSRAAGQLRTPDRGWAFGRQLVRAGLLQDKDVTRVERRRVVQLAEAVLALRTGTYSCEPGQLAGDAQPQQGLEVPRLVAEGVLTYWDANSALEALGGYESTIELVPERLADYEATGAEEAYDYAVLLCNGTRTVREVIDQGKLPEPASLRFLAALRLLDIVVTRPPAARVVAPPPAPPVEAPAPSAEPEAPAAAPPAPAAPAAAAGPAAEMPAALRPVEAPKAAAAERKPAAAPAAPSRPAPPRRGAGAAGAAAASAPARKSRIAWVVLILVVLAAALVVFLSIGWREMSRAPEEAAPEPTLAPASEPLPAAPPVTPDPAPLPGPSEPLAAPEATTTPAPAGDGAAAPPAAEPEPQEPAGGSAPVTSGTTP